MSSFDKNKIFFGLIHYILSEQSNVDWILKTSLVQFTGINSVVDNKKYKQNTVVDDIIDYIYQVKPYHIEFEQFIEKYSSKQDEVLISGDKRNEINNVTFNIRYDAVTSSVDDKPETMTTYEYMDTHAANRLFFYKTKDLNEIKDYLNCHFKGLTVNGNEFNIDKSGYDAFLYDSSLYDAPTISSDYYMVDFTEPLEIPYNKKFVQVGVKSFELESDITKNQITIKSYYDGEEKIITDFSLSDNILSIFYPLKNNEKIIITVTKSASEQFAYVFVGNSFIESDDESNIRKFVPYGTTTFKIPDGNIGSKKVVVHLEKINGTRIPFMNFEKIGDNIIVNKDDILVNEHLILTVIDYQFIYDKIYTYEDPYGQANNTIVLDGDKFLRPYYEAERPSELCVSRPNQYLMVYTYDLESEFPNDVYNVDFKEHQSIQTVSNNMITSLEKELIIGETEIFVKDSSILKQPYVNIDNINVPGVILINSELIEFFEVDNSLNKLMKIRRGTNGSIVKESHPINSSVIGLDLTASLNTTSKLLTISTFVNDFNMTSYNVPGVFYSDEKINVYKKPLIKLLKDIKYSDTKIEISSDNIIKPLTISKLVNGAIVEIKANGRLYINEDIIEYKTIEFDKTNKKYILRNDNKQFNLTKEYKVTDSIIYSSLPELVDKRKYKYNSDINKIVLNDMPMIGECIIITNEI